MFIVGNSIFFIFFSSYLTYSKTFEEFNEDYDLIIIHSLYFYFLIRILLTTWPHTLTHTHLYRFWHWCLLCCWYIVKMDGNVSTIGSADLIHFILHIFPNIISIGLGKLIIVKCQMCNKRKEIDGTKISIEFYWFESQCSLMFPFFCEFFLSLCQILVKLYLYLVLKPNYWFVIQFITFAS